MSDSITQKADVAISNLINGDGGSGKLGGGGGMLNPEQASAFIRMLQEEPTILNQARVVTMNSPKQKVEKIGFASRILRAAPNNYNDVYKNGSRQLTANDRSAPSFGMLELSTKEIIAEVHIPYEVLEDNIEKERLEDTIMSQMVQRVAVDLEELIIMGDVRSTDPYLKLFDGVLLLSDANVVDCRHFSAIDKTLFKAGIYGMPNKYLRNRPAMRFYVSPHCDLEYQDSLANRETGLGDDKLITRSRNAAFGVPLEPTALMPNDKVLFTYPQNILFGVQRQVTIETDKDIRNREYIIVLTMRVDLQMEERDAAVTMFGFTDTGMGITTTDTITL